MLQLPIINMMSVAQKLDFNLMQKKLGEWCKRGQLFALIDPFFKSEQFSQRRELNLKDAPSELVDMIAWDQVTYEAPELIIVKERDLDWILNALATERWGMFVVSTLSHAQLAEHFERYLVVQGPDLNPYFLRFHDPAVIDILLNTWSDDDKAKFWQAITALGYPNLDTVTIDIRENPNRWFKGAKAQPGESAKLSRDQLKFCAEAIDRDLIKVIYWHLRHHHARCVQHISRDVLEKRIEVAMIKARGYGLGSISDLAGFTALMFELSPNFDEHPSFKRIFVDPLMAPDQKLKRLSEVITDRDWSEAATMYDRQYWPKMIKK